jgi:fluoroquinolone transport system ATP-binding protein
MGTTSADPIVAVESLGYTYPGADEPAVREVSFEIGRQEIVGVLGPSGAGKSTTQNVLTGLYDDYTGSVEVFGREVREWDGDYYERVGVSGESPNHYLKLTGRENLQLFASLYDGPTVDPDALLERVGLRDAAAQPVDEYSKGMKMRLNLVRALLQDPPLLFLDEPTTGLDPANARDVRALVRAVRDGTPLAPDGRAAGQGAAGGADGGSAGGEGGPPTPGRNGEGQPRGTTIFLTTHDMTVADDLCDRVAFIVDGRIVAVDNPAALKQAHGDPSVHVEYRDDGALETASFDLPTLGADGDFQQLLASHDVERIHSAEATLEEVFVEVTGTGLS